MYNNNGFAQSPQGFSLSHHHHYQASNQRFLPIINKIIAVLEKSIPELPERINNYMCTDFLNPSELFEARSPLPHETDTSLMSSSHCTGTVGDCAASLFTRVMLLHLTATSGE
ncbi:hypothetical protein ACLK17_18550 [Escherichia coli]